MKTPSLQELEQLRKRSPTGTKIRLIAMPDPQAPPPGTVGKVQFVDDIGDIHVAWQNGSSLALIPGVDAFEVL
mgnify:FL=1